MDLLDLLDNDDRGDLAVRERAIPTGPFICRWCGREERADFLLESNHSPDCYAAVRDRMCMSMRNLRHHVTSSARALATEGEFLPCCWNGMNHAFDPSHALHWLRSYVRRAAGVWPADRFTWLRTALTAEHLPEDLIDELMWEATA